MARYSIIVRRDSDGKEFPLNAKYDFSMNKDLKEVHGLDANMEVAKLLLMELARTVDDIEKIDVGEEDNG